MQDTITGFLLAGVGDVDFKKRSNFLQVTDTTAVKEIESAFRDFTTYVLTKFYLFRHKDTTLSCWITDGEHVVACRREDIAIVLISQFIAEKIRPLVDAYDKPVPAVLEIPSKVRCPRSAIMSVRELWSVSLFEQPLRSHLPSRTIPTTLPRTPFCRASSSCSASSSHSCGEV